MKKIASTLAHAALFTGIVIVLTAVFLGACAPEYEGPGLRRNHKEHRP